MRGRKEGLNVITALEDALTDLCNQERMLQLVRNLTAFDDDASGFIKRIAKPHQYFAVTKAVGSTVQTVASNGKAVVVWHTQGSGKSMEMELYANLISRHPKLRKPTIVVITDRTELDGQLFQGFDRSLLLPEKPKQVRRRSELRDELRNRATGNIYFSTLQKFMGSRICGALNAAPNGHRKRAGRRGSHRLGPFSARFGIIPGTTPELLDNGINRPARFALEVEKLHQRRSLRPDLIQHMRTRPSPGKSTRSPSRIRRFEPCGEREDDCGNDYRDDDNHRCSGDLRRGRQGGKTCHW